MMGWIDLPKSSGALVGSGASVVSSNCSATSLTPLLSSVAGASSAAASAVVFSKSSITNFFFSKATKTRHKKNVERKRERVSELSVRLWGKKDPTEGKWPFLLDLLKVVYGAGVEDGLLSARRLAM